MKNIRLLLSCEHAVNTVPKQYEQLFMPFSKLLDTHQGIDFGALEIAQHLQQAFSCTLIQAEVSRLLIDCNRRLEGKCFSLVTNNCASELKQELIERYYLPYRNFVLAQIKEAIAQGEQVLHCSVHSFTPIWNESLRNADVAFLYDPKRLSEKKLSEQWKLELKKKAPHYKIRMNYPYKGISDGFTTALRKQFTQEEYLGIELECNQSITRNPMALNELKDSLASSLQFSFHHRF
ncbi:MAG: N-formylglutamate amidohydrolase [Legionella sp.]|nr:MAG: N-formylglutamate amidohydrolase [Legionella sp.]PJD98808.1 MAG: N-formylglutamate amidohydrolase [Legionella sp.]